MRLKRVPFWRVFRQAGADAREAFGDAAAQLEVLGHWMVVTPVSDCDVDLASSRFFKSIAENVDGDEKRENFTRMIHALYRAAKHSDYGEQLMQIGMQCKIAHSFTFRGGTQKVWELKRGKKDRIYFFTFSPLIGGKSRPLIVLLVAEHKNSRTTPEHVKRHAESVIKDCLDPQVKLEICKESS